MYTSSGRKIDTSKMDAGQRYTEDKFYMGGHGLISYRHKAGRPLFKGVLGTRIIYYYQIDLDNGELEFDKEVFGKELQVTPYP